MAAHPQITVAGHPQPSLTTGHPPPSLIADLPLSLTKRTHIQSISLIFDHYLHRFRVIRTRQPF
ncbi:hypothetical protein HanIR_Chr15g0736911 [Helianthus annuus]|nr:hypothetical protein HanIR_Chr15g0736911 [Helianthus annuus]